jgi:hypothetical protein
MKATTVAVLTALFISVATTCRAHHPGGFGGSWAPMQVWHHPMMAGVYLPDQYHQMHQQGAWWGNSHQPIGHHHQTPPMPAQHHPANAGTHQPARVIGHQARGLELSKPTERPHRVQPAARKTEPAVHATVEPFDKQGRIAWPALLQREHFAASRKQFDALAAQRHVGHELSPMERDRLNTTQQATITELKRHIHTASSGDYFAALRFVRTLTNDLAAAEPRARLAQR